MSRKGWKRTERGASKGEKKSPVSRPRYATALPRDLDAAERLARRVKANPALWLVWLSAERLSKMHPADLANRYAASGFDIVELRATYAAVRDVAFENDGRGAKAAWRSNLRSKLVALVDRERRGALGLAEARRDEYVAAGAFDLGRAPR